MKPAVKKMRGILAVAKTEVMQVQVSPSDHETLLIQGILASLLANLEKELK